MRKKFDSKLLDNPPRPTTGHNLIFDTKTTGLALRVPSKGTPAFQIVARGPDGRERRITVATWVPHGAVALDGRALDLDGLRVLGVTARDRARRGLPAGAEEAAQPGAGGDLSLSEALELHIAGRAAAGKLQSRAGCEYRLQVHRYLADWSERPLRSISRLEVHNRHQHIGEAHGRCAANAAMRMYRAAYRRAQRFDPSLPACPTSAIEWFEEARRDPGLREDDVPLVLSRIRAISNPIRRDYYEFILFTGMRRGASACVRAEHVDAKRSVLFVPNPKGGAKKAFDLPLAAHVLDLLERRRELNRRGGWGETPFLFPARSSSGHIAEPREQALGFSPHALRHLFTTVAAGAGVQLYLIKLLTNHSLPKMDVTLGYIWPSADQLRPTVNAIAERIISNDPDGPPLAPIDAKTRRTV